MTPIVTFLAPSFLDEIAFKSHSQAQKWSLMKLRVKVDMPYLDGYIFSQHPTS